MNLQSKQSFSIVEIMAVIAIFAILVAVALPSYRDYVVRSKIAEVLQVLEAHLNEAKRTYLENETIPTSVLDIPSNTFTAYSNSKYIAFMYYDDGATWANSGKAAMVQAVVSTQLGSGITGFTAGTSGAHNRITMAFVENGEYLQTYCGTWATDGTEIPASYLPPGCDEVDFSSSVTG